MQITVYPPLVQYDVSEWRLIINSQQQSFNLVSKITGGLEFSSGANLDSLAQLLIEAKADATARGINWNGQGA